MKHAYLIMAHGEWELLRRLVACLDDARNDIFIHIDAKAGPLPIVAARNAGLFYTQRRVDVRWGDVSVVEAEYVLFREAVARGPYAYYHLMSGADLPLKSQDYIHSFFDANAGKEFIGYTLTSVTPEVVRKAMRWHLFPRSFKRRSALRAGFLRLQETLGIYRNRGVDFKKGTQWCSVTDAMARLFLDNEAWAMKTFTHTFCSDEMVMHTLCWHSPLKDNIFSLESDGAGCMRAIGWRNSCLYDWTAADYDTLVSSPALFARKFNSSDWDFIDKICRLSA